MFQCSSASRKFLNFDVQGEPYPGIHVFQCSSASRKFLNLIGSRAPRRPSACAFQCSSASRKFLNLKYANAAGKTTPVSVLFSEPKIPQLRNAASPRAPRALFQCSSASRKFLNSGDATPKKLHSPSFSALQRAENSSIRRGTALVPVRPCVSVLFSEPKIPQFPLGGPPAVVHPGFQCSSASRKFLNFCAFMALQRVVNRFSALQRAENSSIAAAAEGVNVFTSCFSALQRAENSSI